MRAHESHDQILDWSFAVKKRIDVLAPGTARL